MLGNWHLEHADLDHFNKLLQPMHFEELLDLFV